MDIVSFIRRKTIEEVVAMHVNIKAYQHVLLPIKMSTYFVTAESIAKVLDIVGKHTYIRNAMIEIKKKELIVYVYRLRTAVKETSLQDVCKKYFIEEERRDSLNRVIQGVREQNGSTHYVFVLQNYGKITGKQMSIMLGKDKKYVSKLVYDMRVNITRRGIDDFMKQNDISPDLRDLVENLANSVRTKAPRSTASTLDDIMEETDDIVLAPPDKLPFHAAFKTLVQEHHREMLALHFVYSTEYSKTVEKELAIDTPDMKKSVCRVMSVLK